MRIYPCRRANVSVSLSFLGLNPSVYRVVYSSFQRLGQPSVSIRSSVSDRSVFVRQYSVVGRRNRVGRSEKDSHKRMGVSGIRNEWDIDLKGGKAYSPTRIREFEDGNS